MPDKQTNGQQTQIIVRFYDHSVYGVEKDIVEKEPPAERVGGIF